MSSGNSSDAILQKNSSIFLDAWVLFSGNKTNPSATPPNATPASNNLLPAISTSLAKNSPSKLPTFLHYVKDHLGIKDVMDYEYLLANKGYSPDILPYVEDKGIVSCGVTARDAICLKHGATYWWNSPKAKWPCLPDQDIPLLLQLMMKTTGGTFALRNSMWMMVALCLYLDQARTGERRNLYGDISVIWQESLKEFLMDSFLRLISNIWTLMPYYLSWVQVLV